MHGRAPHLTASNRTEKQSGKRRWRLPVGFSAKGTAPHRIAEQGTAAHRKAAQRMAKHGTEKQSGLGRKT